MNVSEFIGFFVFMLALIFSAWRRQRDLKSRQEHPEQYADQEEESQAAMRELLVAMQIDPGEYLDAPSPSAQKAPPPPPPRRSAHRSEVKSRPQRKGIARQFKFEAGLESHHLESTIEQRRLKSTVAARTGDRLVSDSLKVYVPNEAYALKERGGQSIAAELADGLRDPRELFLYHEIFGPPKGLEP